MPERKPDSELEPKPEWKQEIRRRLASLKLDPAREAAIVEEVEQHLADYYAEE